MRFQIGKYTRTVISKKVDKDYLVDEHRNSNICTAALKVIKTVFLHLSSIA